MKVIEKAKEKFNAIGRKVIPVVGSAVIAVNGMMIGASAEEVSSGVDYSGVASSLTAGFTQVINNCISIATAIIPLGLGLIGMGKMLDIAKKFFAKSATA